MDRAPREIQRIGSSFTFDIRALHKHGNDWDLGCEVKGLCLVQEKCLIDCYSYSDVQEQVKQSAARQIASVRALSCRMNDIAQDSLNARYCPSCSCNIATPYLVAKHCLETQQLVMENSGSLTA